MLRQDQSRQDVLLEGRRMRLNRIPLFALMSVLIASGCSASRSSLKALRGGGEDVETPPSHDHEYSPAPYDGDDDFRPPTPHSQPGEPVPAPPAIGVSRVKSVGWLKDLGEKMHPRTDSCIEDCVTDEELIGKCSSIDSCTSEAGCGTEVRVQRYREHVVHQPTDRLNPMRSLKKTWAKLLHKPCPVASTDPCASIVSEPGCSVPSHVEETTVQNFQKQCGELPKASRRTMHAAEKPCRNNETAVELRPTRRRDCLADPLQEPAIDDVQPGLLTPDDIEFQEHLAEPAINAPSQTYEPRLPSEPASDVPLLPPMENSDGRFEPVPAVPQIPSIADPSTKVVEPPLWPKRKGQTIRQISQPSSGNWNGSQQYHAVDPMPEIVPRARR